MGPSSCPGRRAWQDRGIAAVLQRDPSPLRARLASPPKSAAFAGCKQQRRFQMGRKSLLLNIIETGTGSTIARTASVIGQLLRFSPILIELNTLHSTARGCS